jgi:hypothetical protein
MDEFNRQLKRNLKSYIDEFNNKSEYADIRELYKNNFDEIVLFIKRSNPKLAVEDIAAIDGRLREKIITSILLVKEINRAIDQQELSFSDIK